uniref:Uncharacterized protein n=1 Tax=Lepeophtheirus salmonis TaxID=72036 RepID=A0A0K2THN1_LEPSM
MSFIRVQLVTRQKEFCTAEKGQNTSRELDCLLYLTTARLTASALLVVSLYSHSCCISKCLEVLEVWHAAFSKKSVHIARSWTYPKPYFSVERAQTLFFSRGPHYLLSQVNKWNTN